MFRKAQLFTITALLIFLTSGVAEAKFMNRFKDGFYFEKYKTADEVKSALLELHPMGSSVDELIETLAGAGAVEYNPYSYYDTQGDDVKKYKKPLNINYFRYEHRTFSSIFPNSWSIHVRYTENKIESIKVQLYQGE